MGGEPQILDPAIAGDVTQTAIQAMYFVLYKLTSTAPQFNAVESCTISEDINLPSSW